MSQVIAIVILAGAACASPLEQQPRATVAHQVPCAIVVREPVGNPFKIAQEPNRILGAGNSVYTPPAKPAAKKTSRCNGGKVIWLKKKKNGKRRYRCAS
jgi:hypothetical protein